MNVLHSLLAGFLVLSSDGTAASPNDTFTLRERVSVAKQTRCRVHMVVRGKIQTGESESSLSGQALLVYPERVLEVGEDGFAGKVARFYEDARAMFVVGTGKDARQLRPNIRFVIGEAQNQRLSLWSPSGPFTADELELVEDVLNTTRLVGLLPIDPVKTGDTWEPDAAVLKALCDLDHFIESKVKCSLSKIENDTATIAVQGTVKGLELGTEAQSDVKATVTYDLASQMITQVRWSQTDLRSAGPISPAGAYEATINIDREPVESTQLSDDVLQSVSVQANEGSRLLVFEDQNGRYRFFHDRDWHVTTTRPDVVVMRRLTETELVAQLNVNALRKRRAGTKMSADELQAMVEYASGLKINEVLQADALPTDGNYELQMLVTRGSEDNVQLTHRHYLATGRDGREVLFSFIVEPDNLERLGTGDLVLVSTVEFPIAQARNDDGKRK